MRSPLVTAVHSTTNGFIRCLVTFGASTVSFDATMGEAAHLVEQFRKAMTLEDLAEKEVDDAEVN